MERYYRLTTQNGSVDQVGIALKSDGEGGLVDLTEFLTLSPVRKSGGQFFYSANMNVNIDGEPRTPKDIMGLMLTTNGRLKIIKEPEVPMNLIPSTKGEAEYAVERIKRIRSGRYQSRVISIGASNPGIGLPGAIRHY